MESEPELMLEVAELSAELNQGKVEGRGAALLKKVLQTQPDNPQALVLAGTDAYFRQDYPAALRHWERVLAQVPPDSEDARNLGAGIEKVRSLMGQGASTPAPAQTCPHRQGRRSAYGQPVARAQGQGQPGRRGLHLRPPANGPRMPLAVLRMRVADLPKDFTLDDSMAMSPDAKLSFASELRIEARISKGGDAIAKPGDLSGEVSSVKPGATGLKIVIDKTLPAARIIRCAARTRTARDVHTLSRHPGLRLLLGTGASGRPGRLRTSFRAAGADAVWFPKSIVLRPADLARYMAISACLRSSSRLSPCPLNRLMPMLAVQWWLTPRPVGSTSR
jgi:hypothetical protein